MKNDIIGLNKRKDDVMIEADLVGELKKLEGTIYPSLKSMADKLLEVGLREASGIGKGGKNAKDAKKHIERYLRFDKLINIDATTKSKREVIILEVYDQPFPTIDGRGKQGKYIDILRPIILDTGKYEGKLHDLIDHWSMFTEYRKYRCVKQTEITGIEKWTYQNIWKVTSDLTPGEARYIGLMWHKIRESILYCLESLENDKRLEWSEYYCYIPDITADFRDGEELKIKSILELKEDAKNRWNLIRLLSEEENSVLSYDKLKDISPMDIGYDNQSLDDLKTDFYHNPVGKRKINPLKATEKQIVAYENYRLWLRQVCLRQYNQSDSYSTETEKLNNEYMFHTNYRLHSLYLELDEIFRPLLLGWKSVWKEIEFKVLHLHCPVLQQESMFNNVKEFEQKIYSYMCHQVDKDNVRYYCTFRHCLDTEVPFGKASVGKFYQIRTSQRAMELHNILGKWYGTDSADPAMLPEGIAPMDDALKKIS